MSVSLEPQVIWPPSSLSSFPSTFLIHTLQPHWPSFFLTSRRAFCLLPGIVFSLIPEWLFPHFRHLLKCYLACEAFADPHGNSASLATLACCIFLQSTYTIRHLVSFLGYCLSSLPEPSSMRTGVFLLCMKSQHLVHLDRCSVSTYRPSEWLPNSILQKAEQSLSH